VSGEQSARPVGTPSSFGGGVTILRWFDRAELCRPDRCAGRGGPRVIQPSGDLGQPADAAISKAFTLDVGGQPGLSTGWATTAGEGSGLSTW
jgi:hypothetical protein